MDSEYFCAKCGKKLSPQVYEHPYCQIDGKHYCTQCALNFPHEPNGRCNKCIYCYVDDNGAALCRLNDKSIGNGDPCKRFSTGINYFE